jgi:hypothetical protein
MLAPPATQQLLIVGHSLGMHRVIFLAAVTTLQDGHAGAFEIQQFTLGFLQDFRR